VKKICSFFYQNPILVEFIVELLADILNEVMLFEDMLKSGNSVITGGIEGRGLVRFNIGDPEKVILSTIEDMLKNSELPMKCSGVENIDEFPNPPDSDAIELFIEPSKVEPLPSIVAGVDPELAIKELLEDDDVSILEESSEELDPIIIEDSPEDINPDMVEESPDEVDPDIDESPDDADPDIIDDSPEEVDPSIDEESSDDIDPDIIEESPDDADPSIDEESPDDVDPDIIEESPEDADPSIVEESPDPTIIEEPPEEVDPDSLDDSPEEVVPSFVELNISDAVTVVPVTSEIDN